jgi:MFS family permease
VVVQVLGFGTAGVAVFTVLTLAVLPFVLLVREEYTAPLSPPLSRLVPILSRYRWLYYATVVIFGAGGAVTGLYPAFSTSDPGLLGFEIALQNLATIVAVLAASRLSADPIRTIRLSSFGMAVAVGVSFVTPLGFALIGASAGVVQIAQLVYLARTGEPQGVVVGVFTTGSYAGMTVLPVIAALVAESFGYAAAFGLIVLFSLSVVATIGRCRSCRLPVTGATTAP